MEGRRHWVCLLTATGCDWLASSLLPLCSRCAFIFSNSPFMTRFYLVSVIHAILLKYRWHGEEKREREREYLPSHANFTPLVFLQDSYLWIILLCQVAHFISRLSSRLDRYPKAKSNIDMVISVFHLSVNLYFLDIYSAKAFEMKWNSHNIN